MKFSAERSDAEYGVDISYTSAIVPPDVYEPNDVELTFVPSIYLSVNVLAPVSTVPTTKFLPLRNVPIAPVIPET
jgi:hypothetical protein